MGGGELQWWLGYEASLCVLYPLEVVTIVAELDSLAVTPYQRVLCNGLVVSLLVISLIGIQLKPKKEKIRNEIKRHLVPVGITNRY